MPETNHIELTQPVERNTQDIIGDTPGWLLKSGISMLGLVMTAIITLSAFIKFPDKVSGMGIMTSEAPPIEHRSANGGIVDTIFVRHNSLVVEDQPILLIKSPSKVDDVSTLEQFIADYESIATSTDHLNLIFPANLQLGNLQPEYANLEFLYSGLTEKLKEASTDEQIRILRREIAHIGNLNTVLIKQKLFSERELSLIKKNHSRNQILKEDSVISDLDMEKSTLELVKYKKQLEVIENSIIENNIRKEQLRLRIYQLQEEASDLVNEYKLKVQEAVNVLRQGIEEWKDNYYVTAELSGTVSFASSITEKVSLTPGQLVANILPENSSERFVRAPILGSAMGRAEVGNRAILKVDGYPYQDFGVVSSRVSAISLLPKEADNGNTYEMIIPLPDTIVTNYGLEILYSPKRGVSVEIITEDSSILRKVFNEFLNLLKNA